MISGGIPIFTGDASDILKARNTMQPSVLTERVTNAEENAMRSLGLWRDEAEKDKKQLMALPEARNARYGLLPQPAIVWTSQTSYVKAPARGRALRDPGTGRIIRGAELITRGPGRGIVVQGGQREGTVTRGQRGARRGQRGAIGMYARDNAAENAMSSLGLWTDEAEKENKQLMALQEARNAQKNARYGFLPQPAIVWTSQTCCVRAPARGQAPGRGRIIRGAELTARGLGRGIVAQGGQLEGTVTRGQRGARGNTARGRRMRGRGILSIGGSLAPGSTLSTGLGLDEPSSLYATSGQLNFAAVELSDQNDGLQYDNDVEYLASPW